MTADRPRHARLVLVNGGKRDAETVGHFYLRMLESGTWRLSVWTKITRRYETFEGTDLQAASDLFAKEVADYAAFAWKHGLEALERNRTGALRPGFRPKAATADRVRILHQLKLLKEQYTAVLNGQTLVQHGWPPFKPPRLPWEDHAIPHLAR